MTEGIDVSSYQGTVDWKQVKGAGKAFAMIRAGWSWYLGGMTLDQRFLQNAQGAQEAAMPWGVYLYAYDKTPEAARISARKLGAVLSGYQMEYPVAYDFEDQQYLENTPEQNTAICKAFLEELQGMGFYVTLYTYANFAKSYLNMNELTQWDFWVAAYQNPLTSWTGPWGMWQYSATGQVAGIQGKVDLDRSKKDYPSIIREAGLNGFGDEDGQPEGCIPETEYRKLQRQYQELEKEYQAAQDTIRRVRAALEE